MSFPAACGGQIGDWIYDLVVVVVWVCGDWRHEKEWV